MGRIPCCSVEHIKKGVWTAEEDQKLIAYIQQHGEGGWRTLPLKAGLHRCGKSCRLRWTNYLRPDIKRGEFSAEEDQKIIQLQATLGNRWSIIAKQLSGRTDNEIKNYWNTHLKKRISKMGMSVNASLHKSSIVAPPQSQPLTVDAHITNNHESNKNSSNNDPTSATTTTVPHYINVDDDDDVDQRRSNINSTSSMSKFLNKLAGAKQMRSSTCLAAIKVAQCPSATTTEGNSKVDDDNNNNNNNNQDFVSRSISRSSAKLLNKMASRLSTPTVCRDMVKSIIQSGSIYGSQDNAGVGALSMSNSSEVFEKNMSRSASITSLSQAEIVNSTEINDLETLMVPDMLDLDDFFHYWKEMDGCELEGEHDGAIPSTSMVDNYMMG